MPHRRFAAAFACWWLLFAGLGALWALATPIGASPDAPSQVARAVSVVRGQWLGPAVPGAGSAITTYVWVPKTYLDPGLMAHCYMFKENVSAACAPPPGHSARTVRTTTHVGRYPPAYYLAVGWPSLLTSTVAGLYLMQVASVLLGAAFLALAAATARVWSTSALMVPGVAVAATPMALFLSSSVNPSGTEVAAAIAVWTAATVLVAEHLGRPPKGLVVTLAVSTVASVWTRPTALAWPLVTAAVLAPAAWRRVSPILLKRRDILGCGSAVGVAGVGALLWVLLARAIAVGTNFGVLPASSSYGHITSFVIGKLPSLLQQGVGNFGWLDTPAPWFTLAAWATLCVALVIAVLLLGSKRALWSVLLALLASFVVPVASLIGAARNYGYIGQGRYFLAIWVSVPIVAAGFVGLDARSRAARRLRVTVGLLVAGGQAMAYYWALRRYTVGIPAPRPVGR